jgi:hypothetical protein
LPAKHTYWTNPSVLSLIKHSDADPIRTITEKARNLVFDAIERGWTGPPYDPVAVIRQNSIRVRINTLFLSFREWNLFKRGSERVARGENTSRCNETDSSCRLPGAIQILSCSFVSMMQTAKTRQRDHATYAI